MKTDKMNLLLLLTTLALTARAESFASVPTKASVHAARVGLPMPQEFQRPVESQKPDAPAAAERELLKQPKPEVGKCVARTARRPASGQKAVSLRIVLRALGRDH